MALTDGEVPPREYKGVQRVPLARFGVEVRVLGIERYWLGREAHLSPVDFALGRGTHVGPRATARVLDRVPTACENEPAIPERTDD